MHRKDNWQHMHYINYYITFKEEKPFLHYKKLQFYVNFLDLLGPLYIICIYSVHQM